MFLMITLFAFLLLHPVFEARTAARLMIDGFVTLILFSSALAVARQRQRSVAVWCIGVPCVALAWARDFLGLGTPLTLVSAGFLAVFFLLLVTLFVTDVLTAERVTHNTICRAISAYLLIGFAWAAAYELLDTITPEALTTGSGESGWWHYVYFSFMTLTTTGYGDIVPVTPAARSIATVQAIIGPLYVAILLARLVALYGKPFDRAVASGRERAEQSGPGVARTGEGDPPDPPGDRAGPTQRALTTRAG